MNLERFIEAQENSYNTALKEIQLGKKTSHWMWYIFPQYKRLGKSAMATKYAIQSKEEAKAYLEHSVLGSRLKEISSALLNHKDKTARQILGSPDELKLKSSMTLFDAISNNTETVFKQVLETFYDVQKCKTTLQFLNQNNL